jgi:hypothetical protein
VPRKLVNITLSSLEQVLSDGSVVDAVKAITDNQSEERSEKSSRGFTPQTEPQSSEGSEIAIPAVAAKVATENKTSPPLPKVDPYPSSLKAKAFPRTITGLEEARLQCRFNMTRIVQEVSNCIPL